MKKGTIVTGIGSEHYSITTSDALMVVTSAPDSYVPVVTVVGSVRGSYIGSEFNVDEQYFRETTADDWLADHPGARIDFKLLNSLVLAAETETVSVSLAMDPEKYGKYNISPEEKRDIKKEIQELLEKYDYDVTDDGIGEIVDEWVENKGWLINLLRKHPNYVEGKYQIVFSSDYERPRDEKAVSDFYNWVTERLARAFFAKRKLFRNMEHDEIEAAAQRLYRFTNNTQVCLVYSKRPEREIVSRIDAAKEDYNLFEDFLSSVERVDLLAYGEHFLSPNDVSDYNKASRFISRICGYEAQNADEDLVTFITHTYPELKVGVGKKVSGIVGKWAKLVGLDQVEEWGVDHNGNKKNYGWNYRFALYGDAVNPLKVKRHTIISVNPVDYLTMSFGHNWASCHTIDKENLRGVGSNHYRGCYSSGTLSYMLDGSSVVFYLVDAEYKGNQFELQDKEKRCMFHLGQDKMVQGRVYPDARDGGDQGLAAQMRGIMQKVIADCLERDNLWSLKKGTGECTSVINSYGTHYNDYAHYADCNVSYLDKGNTKMFPVGHNPICPCCGEEHDSEEWITCDACRDDVSHVHCARCGERIDLEGDYVYDEDTGNYYCDSECAADAGCYYCENTYDYRSEDVFEDNYNGCHYYDNGNRIVTYDGNEYYTAANAGEDGYCYCDEDDEWHREDEVIYCEHCERYVLTENYDTERDMCNDCAERNEEEVA